MGIEPNRDLSTMVAEAIILIEAKGLAQCQRGYRDGVATGQRRWINPDPRLNKMARDAIAPSLGLESMAGLQAVANTSANPWRVFFQSMDAAALARFITALKQFV